MTNRTRAALALAVLGAIHGAVLLAGFLSPYDPAQQHRESPFSPPTRVHFFDRQGRPHLRPFVETGGRDFPVRFFVSGAPYRLLGVFQCRRHLFGVDEPGRVFLLGADEYGRDQFSRMVYGGRVSLTAGLLATTLSLGLGLCLGVLSGFYGRWLDALVMRGAELFVALPWLYLLLAARALLPLDVDSRDVFLVVVCVIGVVGWARPARVIRGVVLSARERDYVLAARAFGAADLYLMRRHVLPQVYGVALTQATLLVPQYVLAEVTLSFLGLGAGEPFPSWGTMLAALRHYHVLTSYWWMFAPGLALVPVLMGYHALARAVEDGVGQAVPPSS